MIYTHNGRRLSLSLCGCCDKGEMVMFLLMRGLQLILIWFRLSPGVIRLPICLMWPKGLMEMDISMLLSSSIGCLPR